MLAIFLVSDGIDAMPVVWQIKCNKIWKSLQYTVKFQYKYGTIKRLVVFNRQDKNVGISMKMKKIFLLNIKTYLLKVNLKT